MGTPGPQKVSRYGIEFKLRAVKMSEVAGVMVKDVAESLCIHPFMLSKWRKQLRDGVLTGEAVVLDAHSVAELVRLRELEIRYQRLVMERDLLKKAIRFASVRKPKSSLSSKQTASACIHPSATRRPLPMTGLRLLLAVSTFEKQVPSLHKPALQGLAQCPFRAGVCKPPVNVGVRPQNRQRPSAIYRLAPMTSTDQS